jgi:hypothetical protein
MTYDGKGQITTENILAAYNTDTFVQLDVLTPTAQPYDITGYTAHMRIALPDSFAPLGASIVSFTPSGGFTCGNGILSFLFSHADIQANNLPVGTYGYEIVVSDDGGTTVFKCNNGNIQMGAFMSATW